MRSVYQTRDAIAKLLEDAKTPANELPFVVRATTNIYDYQPSDFSFDGQATRDGVYIYFEKTRLDEADADTQTQSHRPRFHLDMYTSVPAQRSAGTGEIDSAVRRANRSVENLDVEMYEALSHSAFRRLLEETLVPGGDWTPPAVHVSEVENLGVLKTPKTNKTLAVHRIVLLVEVCENHDMVVGVPYVDTVDFVEPHTVGEGV